MTDEDDKVVTLALFFGEIEAEMIAQALRAEGIDAQMAGGLTAGFRADVPGRVKVLVHAKDYAASRAIMEDYFKSKEEIDWSQVDIGDGEADDADDA